VPPPQEVRLVAITNGDRSGSVEKEMVYVVARHLRTHPRFGVVSPLLPKPPQVQGMPKSVQVRHSHAPQLLWLADRRPIHQAMSPISVLLAFLEEGPSDFINLLLSLDR
jgi:hypothetical protein